MKPSHKHKPLKDTLLERIESEDVRPRSRLFFQGRECIVWLLWVISIAIGALSIAVSLYVVSHSQYAMYEATHQNLLTYLVDVLPYLWVVTFGLMVVVAVYNLRHTKKGYKYPLWVILTSSVVLSFAGGSALQLFGLGYSVDSILGDNMEMYMSQDKMTQKMWQNPEEGRLMGRQVFSTVAPTSTVVFEDMSGQRWQLSVSDLPAQDIALLAAGNNVRILGKATNNSLMIFHACGAFSSMSDKAVAVGHRQQERDVFMARMYDYRLEAEADVLLPGRTDEEICANLPLPIK